MIIKLDLIDKKILYRLDINARQSNSEIAKTIRLNKDSVGYRIKRLETQGIIRAYRAVIDSSRLGYMFYRVFFNFIDMQPKKLEELIDFLKNEKNVWWIAKLDGKWGLAFAIWVKSNKEFNEFYYKLELNFKPNIKESLVCQMMSYKNLSRKYLSEKKEDYILTSVGEGGKQDIDSTDLKIMQFLAENARVPLINIAQELKLDSMTIYHRIKKLENKKIIQGYKVDLDFTRLGREFYSVKINLSKISQIKEIKNYILMLPEVTATTEAIGSYDIEFDLEVENSERYFRIINDLTARFDFIREIIYFRVLENYKILYMPEI